MRGQETYGSDEVQMEFRTKAVGPDGRTMHELPILAPAEAAAKGSHRELPWFVGHASARQGTTGDHQEHSRTQAQQDQLASNQEELSRNCIWYARAGQHSLGHADARNHLSTTEGASCVPSYVQPPGPASDPATPNNDK